MRRQNSKKFSRKLSEGNVTLQVLKGSLGFTEIDLLFKFVLLS